MNILKEKFALGFTTPSRKRKYTEHVVNDGQTQKRNKGINSFEEDRNENQIFLIESGSDNDEDIFS